MVRNCPGIRASTPAASRRRIIWWAEGPSTPRNAAISFSEGGMRCTFV